MTAASVFRTIALIPQRRLQPRHGDAIARQLIGAFVHVMAGMALHPMPAYFVGLQGGIEWLPQMDVLYRLLVGRAPASLLRPLHPCVDAVPYRLALGIGLDS